MPGTRAPNGPPTCSARYPPSRSRALEGLRVAAYRGLCDYDHPADPIGLEPTADGPEHRAARVAPLAASRNALQQALDDRKAVRMSAEDYELEDEGNAWPTLRPPERDAILRPPARSPRVAAAHRTHASLRSRPAKQRTISKGAHHGAHGCHSRRRPGSPHGRGRELGSAGRRPVRTSDLRTAHAEIGPEHMELFTPSSPSQSATRNCPAGRPAMGALLRQAAGRRGRRPRPGP